MLNAGEMDDEGLFADAIFEAGVEQVVCLVELILRDKLAVFLGEVCKGFLIGAAMEGFEALKAEDRRGDGAGKDEAEDGQAACRSGCRCCR